jgi:4-amino-4-deoxy-L-arabinose transferase-like glycosyltransferase
MRLSLSPPLLWTGLWLAVVGAALAVRPPLPVDETRYLSVAWEMWRSGQFLVPRLNGEAYSHKPPLLFWLMHAGWAAFGVNGWWPRLVAPLSGLAAVFLTAALARRLWPGEPGRAEGAALVLSGTIFWTLSQTLTMFDMLLAAATLAGLIGVLRAWRLGGFSGFLLLGAGIGIGVLAKGPAILVHTLPAALLAPFWGPGFAGADDRRFPPGGWLRWYAGVLLAVAVGAAIGLAWALPAAVAGGPAYAKAIFWGQSAGRLVDAFDHGRPWWFYLALLPALLLPWIAWPALWRGARRTSPAALAGGLGFCLAWFLPAFLLFSLFSGKQAHYLLPELPALALMIAARLFRGGRAGEADTARRRLDDAVPGFVAAAFGLALVVVAWLPEEARVPWWLAGIDGLWGLAAVAGGAALALRPPTAPMRRAAALAALSALLVAVAHLAARPSLARAFDLGPAAERLARFEREGRPLAFFGTYHGQFHFLGRLEKPMAEIGLAAPDDTVWVAANPNGIVVSVHRRLPEAPPPLLWMPFRNRLLTFWEAAAIRAHPQAVGREGEP